MKTILLAIAALVCVAFPAAAADLMGPPTLAAVENSMSDRCQFTRCYVDTYWPMQTSAMTALASSAWEPVSTKALSGFIVSAFGRVDFDDTTLISFGPRVGYAVNPHLMAYGFVDYRTSLSDAGSGAFLDIGAGLETYVMSNTSAFFEVSRDLASFGDADGDANTFRVGARYRFGLPSF